MKKKAKIIKALMKIKSSDNFIKVSLYKNKRLALKKGNVTVYL